MEIELYIKVIFVPPMRLDLSRLAVSSLLLRCLGLAAKDSDVDSDGFCVINADGTEMRLDSDRGSPVEEKSDSGSGSETHLFSETAEALEIMLKSTREKTKELTRLSDDLVEDPSYMDKYFGDKCERFFDDLSLCFSFSDEMKTEILRKSPEKFRSYLCREVNVAKITEEYKASCSQLKRFHSEKEESREKVAKKKRKRSCS